MSTFIKIKVREYKQEDHWKIAGMDRHPNGNRSQAIDIYLIRCDYPLKVELLCFLPFFSTAQSSTLVFKWKRFIYKGQENTFQKKFTHPINSHTVA